MITFFSTPKVFKGHFDIIQRNAIKSWKRSGSEILLFGDDEGTRDVALEYNVSHYPDVKKNEFGTPLLNDIFEKAQMMSKNDILCYANCDIIFLTDIYRTAETLATYRRNFLIVGQRWDLAINAPVNFESRWEKRLKEQIKKSGVFSEIGAIDYFMFKKGQLFNLPPFSVGRPAWDNWMIGNARALKIPVIDATNAITAIHQNHDYSHLKNINNRFGDGPEARANLALAGLDKSKEKVFTIYDADKYIIGSMILPIIFPRINHRIRRPKHSFKQDIKILQNLVGR